MDVSTTKPRIVLLLTATIDTKGMAYVKRTDSQAREKDYIKVIERLGAVTTYPIIFCENSGADLSRIQEALARARPHGDWEILQFDGQDFPKELGKGYGELLIIRYALQHSRFVDENTRVLKLTGRYFPENLSQVLAPFYNTDVFVLADFVPGARYAYSGLFMAKCAFLERYLIPLQDFLDDSQKQTMEMALQKALERAKGEGNDVRSFLTRPIISGISGTWNVPLDKKHLNEIVLSMPKLRRIARSYKNSAIRRLRNLFGRPRD